MKKILMLLVLFAFAVNAQDSKVPGGDYKAPLKSEIRNGKMIFASDDGKFSWWFDARIQFDAAMYFENKNPLSNGSLFRRNTFAVKATLWEDWQAEWDIDVSENVLDLRDMFIKYSFPGTNLSLRAGNFKEPIGMERLNSSRLLTFLERTAITNAIALGRRAGFEARYFTDYGQITAAIMGHELGTKIDKGTQDEGSSTNLRLSLAPINKHGFNLHVGAAGSYKIPEVTAEVGKNGIEINARTESYVFDPKFLHTGDILNVNYYNRYGLELAFITGPLLVYGEWLGTSIYRWDLPTVNLRGGYATASYMLTGETRYYYVDEGEIGAPEEPKSKWGALELAARFSYTNLNDIPAGIKGGMSRQYMFGLNYYPNMNIKLQFNYSILNLDEFATSKGRLNGDDDHSFVQMRFQSSL